MQYLSLLCGLLELAKIRIREHAYSWKCEHKIRTLYFHSTSQEIQQAQLLLSRSRLYGVVWNIREAC